MFSSSNIAPTSSFLHPNSSPFPSSSSSSFQYPTPPNPPHLYAPQTSFSSPFYTSAASSSMFHPHQPLYPSAPFSSSSSSSSSSSLPEPRMSFPTPTPGFFQQHTDMFLSMEMFRVNVCQKKKQRPTLNLYVLCSIFFQYQESEGTVNNFVRSVLEYLNQQEHQLANTQRDRFDTFEGKPRIRLCYRHEATVKNTESLETRSTKHWIPEEALQYDLTSDGLWITICHLFALMEQHKGLLHQAFNVSCIHFFYHHLIRIIFEAFERFGDLPFLLKENAASYNKETVQEWLNVRLSGPVISTWEHENLQVPKAFALKDPLDTLKSLIDWFQTDDMKQKSLHERVSDMARLFSFYSQHQSVCLHVLQSTFQPLVSNTPSLKRKKEHPYPDSSSFSSSKKKMPSKSFHRRLKEKSDNAKEEQEQEQEQEEVEEEQEEENTLPPVGKVAQSFDSSDDQEQEEEEEEEQEEEEEEEDEETQQREAVAKPSQSTRQHRFNSRLSFMNQSIRHPIQLNDASQFEEDDEDVSDEHVSHHSTMKLRPR